MKNKQTKKKYRRRIRVQNMLIFQNIGSLLSKGHEHGVVMSTLSMLLIDGRLTNEFRVYLATMDNLSLT